jgi:hypothetical protein
MYSRSPLTGVSSPSNFVHQVHVGFDPISGAFTGLPEQWTRLLTSSAITKEDYAKNPQAVLDVLEFYTESQKREREEFGLGSLGVADFPHASPSAYASTSSSPAPSATRFGAGTGLGGQRIDSLAPTIPPTAVSRAPNGLGSAMSRSDSGGTLSQSGMQRSDSSHGTVDTLSERNLAARDQPPPAARTPSPSSTRPSASAARPDLVPQRRAPAVPGASSKSATSGGASSAATSGLKPLVTQAASRSHVNGGQPGAAAAPSQRTPGGVSPSDGSAGAKPLHLAGQARKPGPSGPAGPPPAASSGAASRPAAPATKPPPGAGAAPAGERRISKMSESEIQAKLRQVTSPSDPHRAYQRIKKVGQGASGSVYVAKVIETGEKVAIKIMDLAAQPRKELIINEILVMKESRHDNIVNFRDSYLVKSTELWVVMDYMEGGALTDVIDNHTLEEDQISAICQEVCPPTCPCSDPADRSLQTCAGLQHLHMKSIIHRDIKSDK